ncbi:NAD(FAD)-dependent dehydrogenase, partial [Pseudoalteromonas sp. SIMBA_153]
SSEVTEINPAAQTVTITDNANESSDEVNYDMLHVVPPQSAPDWIKASPVAKADDPNGYVEIDPNTLQHVRWPEIFSLGDAGSSPNSKTG